MAKREMKTKIDEEIIIQEEQVDVIEPKEEKPSLLYKITGCSKLRVRKRPDEKADVVCLIDETNELTVKEVEGNKNWVKVTTDSGEKGFCMKKFVTIK